MATNKTSARTRGPRRISTSEYKRVGIELISADPLLLRCQVCGCRWNPWHRAGGRLYRLHWVCPDRQCNRA